MTSHSSGSGRINYSLIERPERVCDMCGFGYFPATDEPVCRECVRKLFESIPDEEIAHHDPKAHTDTDIDEGVDCDSDEAS